MDKPIEELHHQRLESILSEILEIMIKCLSYNKEIELSDLDIKGLCSKTYNLFVTEINNDKIILSYLVSIGALLAAYDNFLNKKKLAEQSSPEYIFQDISESFIWRYVMDPFIFKTKLTNSVNKETMLFKFTNKKYQISNINESDAIIESVINKINYPSGKNIINEINNHKRVQFENDMLEIKTKLKNNNATYKKNEH